MPEELLCFLQRPSFQEVQGRRRMPEAMGREARTAKPGGSESSLDDPTKGTRGQALSSVLNGQRSEEGPGAPLQALLGVVSLLEGSGFLVRGQNLENGRCDLHAFGFLGPPLSLNEQHDGAELLLEILDVRPYDFDIPEPCRDHQPNQSPVSKVPQGRPFLECIQDRSHLVLPKRILLISFVDLHVPDLFRKVLTEPVPRCPPEKQFEGDEIDLNGRGLEPLLEGIPVGSNIRRRRRYPLLRDIPKERIKVPSIGLQGLRRKVQLVQPGLDQGRKITHEEIPDNAPLIPFFHSSSFPTEYTSSCISDREILQRREGPLPSLSIRPQSIHALQKQRSPSEL